MAAYDLWSRLEVGMVHVNEQTVGGRWRRDGGMVGVVVPDRGPVPGVGDTGHRTLASGVRES